jgi:hypothetical protein
MSRRIRLTLAAALVVPLAVPLAAALRPAHAQELNRAFGTMNLPSVLAGACTGSTNGGGNGFAGQQPTETHFDVTERLCDIKTANGPVGATSTFPGVAPQQLHAHASADYGVARVFAEQHVQNWQNQGLVFPRSVGQAGWVDMLTIHAPGLTGQAGTITGAVHIDGTFYAHGHNGFAGYRATAYDNVAGNPPIDIFSITRQDDPAEYVFDELRQVTFNFVYGTPFKVGVFAHAFGSNASEGVNHIPGDVLVDFDNSLVWEGILSVTAGGVAVQGYTIDAASGDPWMFGAVAAVPEPSTVALLAGGLATLAAAARRRRTA